MHWVHVYLTGGEWWWEPPSNRRTHPLSPTAHPCQSKPRGGWSGKSWTYFFEKLDCQSEEAVFYQGNTMKAVFVAILLVAPALAQVGSSHLPRPHQSHLYRQGHDWELSRSSTMSTPSLFESINLSGSLAGGWKMWTWPPSGWWLTWCTIWYVLACARYVLDMC